MHANKYLILTTSPEFLREAPDQFNRVGKMIDEDLTKPTTNLSDLVICYD